MTSKRLRIVPANEARCEDKRGACRLVRRRAARRLRGLVRSYRVPWECRDEDRAAAGFAEVSQALEATVVMRLAC